MTRISRVVLVCAGLALPGWQMPAHAEDPASTAKQDRFVQLQERFQAGLDAICTKYELPGMTAAYALPDARVVAFASGAADKESGAKMTVDARMPAGSIGKTFVAATAIGLARDGKLSLDDKIEKWLGEASWYDDLPNGHEITVRNLLMHRGGLADHIYDPKWIGEARQMVRSLDTDPDYYFKPTELVQFILNRKPLFPAGQGFKYTDTGYILLGLIIERAGGATYYDQARQRFLEPLKLTLTEPADHRDIVNLAAGYLSPKNPFGLPEKITADGKLRYNPATEWTGGGLVSNPQDLVRWAKALYEGRALEKPYLDELLATDPKDDNKASKYGLGVYVTKSNLGTSYGHGGWSVGYLSHVAYYPAQRVAVAVQTNTDVRDDMLGDLMALFNDVLQTVGPAP